MGVSVDGGYVIRRVYVINVPTNNVFPSCDTATPAGVWNVALFLSPSTQTYHVKVNAKLDGAQMARQTQQRTDQNQKEQHDDLHTGVSGNLTASQSDHNISGRTGAAC